MTDFIQPPAAVSLESSPQAGVFYVLRNILGEPEQYCLATSTRQKNGKHVVYLHDLFHGPRAQVVKVGMDSHWFSLWTRAHTVPAHVHKLLTTEITS